MRNCTCHFIFIVLGMLTALTRLAELNFLICFSCRQQLGGPRKDCAGLNDWSTPYWDIWPHTSYFICLCNSFPISKMLMLILVPALFVWIEWANANVCLLFTTRFSYEKQRPRGSSAQVGNSVWWLHGVREPSSFLLYLASVLIFIILESW